MTARHQGIALFWVTLMVLGVVGQFCPGGEFYLEYQPECQPSCLVPYPQCFPTSALAYG